MSAKRASQLTVGDQLRFEFNDPIGRITGQYKVYWHRITHLFMDHSMCRVTATTDRGSEFTYHMDELVPGYWGTRQREGGYRETWA